MPDTLHTDPTAGRQARTPRLGLAVRWLWVALPLTWGIVETLRTSLSFFR